jgi:hypothetical protein
MGGMFLMNEMLCGGKTGYVRPNMRLHFYSNPNAAEAENI